MRGKTTSNEIGRCVYVPHNLFGFDVIGGITSDISAALQIARASIACRSTSDKNECESTAWRYNCALREIGILNEFFIVEKTCDT